MFKQLCFSFLSIFVVTASTVASPINEQHPITIEVPWIIIKDVPETINISVDSVAIGTANTIATLSTTDTTLNVSLINGKGHISLPFHGKGIVTVTISPWTQQIAVSPIPIWFSIVPPLLAITLALVLKEVFTSLFIGLLIGAATMHFYAGSNVFIAVFKGIFSIVDTYIINALADASHASIIVFSLLIGGMVGLVTINGGMRGIVNALAKRANTPRSGQMITYLLGLAIFFDDYANTMVVGTTMRPITDRLKISREKLAYLVDATAAPVAALALITTWIGIELSYIQEGLSSVGINENAYAVFIKSLNTRFYPIFSIIFIFVLIWKKRDFGLMLKFERKARSGEISYEKNELGLTGEIIKESAINPRWYNAAIPVLIVILGTFAALIYTGWKPSLWSDTHYTIWEKLLAIIGGADSFKALLWSSIMGVVAAITLTLTQRLLTLNQSMDALLNGIKTMLPAILILVLAWALASMTQQLHTAEFISGLLIKAKVSPYLMPALTFILAAAISFSTGTSWGTMAILYPLILPATWMINQQHGLDADISINLFYGVISSILAGAVFGDHCSPISDTTILSSLTSGCTHINHVNTQMPYALTVAGVSMVFGILPASFGISTWILYPLGTLAIWIIITRFGKESS
jgi:Na+/H+ antiporter